MSDGIDVSGLKEAESWTGGTGMLGVGWHQVAITGAEEGTSSGGHDQVEIQFEAPAGGEIRDWLVFAPSKKPGEVSFGLKKARGLLECLGIDLPAKSFPTADLLGKQIDVFVAEEPHWNDPLKTQKKVQGYAVAGSESTGTSGPGSDIPADDSGLPF